MQYATLREKIAAEKNARASRYAEFSDLYQRAIDAGVAAAAACIPAPMVVVEADPLTDKPIGRSWVVDSGPCGFAWVNVYPGNSSFALWLKKTGSGWRKPYGESGLQLWIGDYGQSVERKSAFAEAFAAVLRDAGIKAYAGSRLD